MNDNVIKTESGIIFDSVLFVEIFHRYNIDCISKLRRELLEEVPSLYEKINKKSKYLGYGKGNESNIFYIYLQNKKMVLDIKLRYEMKQELLNRGFKIHEKNNYQSRSGWVTGIHIDYDCSNFMAVLRILIEALK